MKHHKTRKPPGPVALRSPLKAERDQLYNLLETLPFYVILLTPDYHVPFANRFFRDRFGEAKGRRCYEYLFGRTEPCEVCHTYEVLKTHAPLEWDWRGPDGRDYHIYDKPFGEDGSTFILEVGVDVTERNKTENALRKSQTQLLEAQRIAHIGSWELDLVDNVLTWSDEIYRIFEIDPKEFGASYEAFLALVHPDDREAVNKAYTDSVKNKTPYAILHRLLFPDGRIKVVHERCETFYDAGGAPLRSVGTVQDVTAQVQTEEKLRMSEERYRSLVTATAQIIWTTDAAGQVNTDMPTWSGYTGQTFEQMSGSGWAEAVHPKDREPTKAVWKQAVDTRSVYQTEYRLRRYDGEYRWFVARGAPVLEKDGTIREWVGTCTDITERIASEEKIRRLNRLYSVLSQTNQAIVRTRNDSVLFDEICRVAVEYGQFRMAWIGLVDDTSKTIRPVSSSGVTDDYLSTLRVSVSDNAEGRGPTGTALREGRIVTCDDFLTDPRMEPWREKAKKLGFRSSAAVPFKRGGKLAGALSVYAEEPNLFDDDEVQLLQEIGTDISFALDGLDAEQQRREAEERLRRSEERFRRLFEEDLTGDYIKTPEGVLKTCNSAFARIFGFASIEEAVGTNMRELYADPKRRQHLQDLIRKSRKAELYEVDMVRRDGKVIHVIENAVGHFDERGELQEIVGYVFDNTERKKAEDELLQSNARFRRIFDANIVGVVNGNAAGEIIMANDYYLNLIGYSRKELEEGKVDWRAVTPPEWLPADEKAYAELKEHGKCAPYEKEYQRRDGSRVTVFIANAALTGPGDEIAAFVLDITERKRAEEEIRRLNEQLKERVRQRTAQLEAANIDLKNEDWQRQRAEAALQKSNKQIHEIIESIQDGFFAVDTSWRFTYINQRAASNVGCSPEELLGKNIWEVFPKILGTAHEAAYRKAMTDRVPGDIEIEGQVTPGMYDIRVYPSAEGISVFWVDITERKRIEDEIKRLNVDLQHRATLLEAANKELEAFAYSVSHDLRAPLRSIDGFSQALLEDYGPKLDDQGKSSLKRVRAAAQRMGQLIDDMLSLSRVTRAEMDVQSVNLSSIVEDIAEELQRIEPNRRMTFAIAPAVTATIDAKLARILLENLIGNAWKFTAKHPAARIEFGTTERDGKKVYFVRDDGAGFEMEYVDKLFKAFQRLHKPEEFPGTGIGLATVQRILHRHGGRVWAEGEPEKGATFYFSL